jgi:hypothetical protein
MKYKNGKPKRESNLVSISDAAPQIGVTASAIYAWIDREQIAFVTISDVPFIPESEIARIIKEREGRAHG